MGLSVSRWGVVGAAAPTTVVMSPDRVADPATVLEAVAAASPASVRKIALVEPPGGSDLYDASYTFAEVVRVTGGTSLDLTAQCGHSMIAAAAQFLRTVGSASHGTIRIGTRRSGELEIIVCSLHQTGTDRFEASVQFPIDLSRAYPLGTAALDVDGLSITVINCGNLYSFVDARQLGISTPHELFAVGEDVRQTLLAVRRRIAPIVGVAHSLVLPKPAVALRTSSSEVCVRAISIDNWHPALAFTGIVATAAFMNRGRSGVSTFRIVSRLGSNDVRCVATGERQYVEISNRTVSRV